jgi:putative transposase
MITPMTEDRTAGELVPLARQHDPFDMSTLAEQLVAAAAGQGIQLTGEGGLLTALTRQVLQTAPEAEMAEHLGYDKRDPASHAPDNK